MKIQGASLLQTVNATFLIAGTCIGGGMLALPITSGQGGYFPSLCFMLIAWAYMCITGLFIGQASFWLKDKNAHMASICGEFYGKPGRAIAWIVYLFVGYASLVAYIDGAGKIFNASLTEIFPSIDQAFILGPLLFSIIFGAFFLLGGKCVETVCSLLFIGLLASYFLIIGFGFQGLQFDYLLRENWDVAHYSLPVLLTIFSYQAIVPSLPNLLNQDPKAVKTSIFCGTLLAFLVYAIWQTIIIGQIPFEGEHSLMKAFTEALPATEVLKAASNAHAILPVLATFFSFFAIVTSFLGIGLGLYDFLGDGLKISKKGIGSLTLACLVVIPSFLVAIAFKRVFLLAMDTTGGFGDSLLNGILPILIIWKGYYLQKRNSNFRMLRNRVLLAALLLFSFAIIFMESLNLIKEFG